MKSGDIKKVVEADPQWEKIQVSVRAVTNGDWGARSYLIGVAKATEKPELREFLTYVLRTKAGG